MRGWWTASGSSTLAWWATHTTGEQTRSLETLSAAAAGDVGLVADDSFRQQHPRVVGYTYYRCADKYVEQQQQ
jgi:hypothetical protein